MKRILITGAGSFIGTSFEKYIKNHPNHEEYSIDVMDTFTGNIVGSENTGNSGSDSENACIEQDKFKGYDVIFHVAGIAHADTGKVSDEGKELYKKVNTDLAIDVAKKARAAGVKQFIFMSSAIVYGASSPIGKEKVITKDTEPAPENFYGESKLNAEIGLNKLKSAYDFKVVILRPPMIYGSGCKGNYNSLRKFALKFPLFPRVSNERSMLYIDNLCEFIRLVIDNDESGTFHPANAELSNTSEMVRLIANAHGKKIGLIGGFTWLLKIMSHFTGLINKAFGNLTYASELTEYKANYRIYSLEDSIKRTEN
ncbi:MAG: NAD-dependent epimerase/dehydratase family protein [Lachnospiraceae bacterium]|nr:NAD-dependent epimerase/dehydratase family protein [Lachnospiraceae bacterium]